MAPEHPDAANDVVLVKLFWEFMTNLVANRCWSQAFFVVLPPYHFAAAFLANKNEQNEAAAIWKRAAEALLKLEKFVHLNPGHLAGSLLADVAVHHWQFTGEMWALGQSNNWDPCSREFRKQAFLAFAGPSTTKVSCEAAFNHIKDSNRQSKGTGPRRE